MRFGVWVATFVGLCFLLSTQSFSQAQEPTTTVALKLVNIGPTGFAIKRPVFAGACKACPWGVLALITQAAMKSSGYDVRICFVCWSEYGPREIADRSKPIFPSIDADDPIRSYIEDPPDAVPDISATSESNLIAAWDGTGPYAKDHQQRRNYRLIAVVHQPNFLMMAASKKIRNYGSVASKGSCTTDLDRVHASRSRNSIHSRLLRDHRGRVKSAWRRLFEDR